MRPRFAAAILTALLGFADARSANADESAAARHESTRHARDIHEKGRYPNDLLLEPTVESNGSSSGGAARPRGLYGGQGAPSLVPDPDESNALIEFLEGLSFPKWLADLAKVLGWGALVLLGLFLFALIAGLVYLLYRFRPKLDSEAKPEPETRHKEAASREIPLDPLLVAPLLGHEDLASSGRYREAMHALLLEALGATGFRPEGRARGLTAREIVRAFESGSPRQRELFLLLGHVERVWFGGQEASEATYRRTLASFEAFTETGAPR